MHYLKNPWLQVLVVAALGASAGLAYQSVRAADVAWSSTHYRLDENMGFPMSRGVPFRQQFILDANGGRIEVPLEDGQAIDFDGAAWWNVDDSGRMRTWNEQRSEVFPVLTRPRQGGGGQSGGRTTAG